jgi:5'-3' exonuclease
MQALIDMDIVVFRCAASAEEDPFGIAQFRASDLFDQILEKTNADSYRAFFTGPTNFRKQYYPEYKANRTAPKPKHLDDLRAWAVEQLNAEVATDGLEADDMLGIEQYTSFSLQDVDIGGEDGYLGDGVYFHKPDETIICSLDKDLLQIPGKHFSWEINGKGWSKPDTWTNMSELEGLRLFYEQCLKGDRTDNIRGIEKIGDKKAKAILADCQSEQAMLTKVLHEYGNDDEFLMNANCLWILRNLNEPYEVRYHASLQE